MRRLAIALLISPALLTCVGPGNALVDICEPPKSQISANILPVAISGHCAEISRFTCTLRAFRENTARRSENNTLCVDLAGNQKCLSVASEIFPVPENAASLGIESSEEYRCAFDRYSFSQPAPRLQAALALAQRACQEQAQK